MTDPQVHELRGFLATPDPATREAGWDRFVATYSRLLLHVARSVVHDPEDARDAFAFILEQLRAQEFRRLRAYQENGRGKFTTWLVVVARRLSLDHHRLRYGRTPTAGDAAGREDQVRRRLVDLLGEDIEPTEIAAPADGNPAVEFERQHRVEVLAAATARLPARDRLLIHLRFEDDLPVREIARVMGFATPFHVYRRLNKVLRSLRILLEREGLEGTPS